MPKDYKYRTMGTKLEIFYKKGNWLEKPNGKQFDWRLYLTSQNRIYTANTHYDKEQWIIWMDGGYLGFGAVTDVDVIPNSEKILGYDCDEVILYTEQQDTFRYFFSNELPINYRHFENCKALRFNVWTRYTQAMPLKMVVSEKVFGSIKYTITATHIQPMKIDDRVFTMPIEGRKTKPDWSTGHLEFIGKQ